MYEQEMLIIDEEPRMENGEVKTDRLESYLDKARRIVLDHNNSRAEGRLHLDEIYVVWFTKTLQNWKALVSTEINDGLYYEVTYDGEKKQAYLDVYAKLSNHVVAD